MEGSTETQISFCGGPDIDTQRFKFKWTHLAFGAGHPLVAGGLRLPRRPLPPDADGDAGVGEDQDSQGHDELQREQGEGVVVLLRPRGPYLAADVSDGCTRTKDVTWK